MKNTAAKLKEAINTLHAWLDANEDTKLELVPIKTNELKVIRTDGKPIRRLYKERR